MGKAKFNRIEAVYEQYQHLQEKLTTARDPQEKNRLFRRLANLLGVLEFLISISKTP